MMLTCPASDQPAAESQQPRAQRNAEVGLIAGATERPGTEIRLVPPWYARPADQVILSRGKVWQMGVRGSAERGCMTEMLCRTYLP